MTLTNLTPSLNTPCPPQLPWRSLHNKKTSQTHTHTGSPSPLHPSEQWHHFGFGVFEMESGLHGVRRKWEQTISWQTNGLHSNLSYDVSLQSGRRKERNGAKKMEKWQVLGAKLDESQGCLSERILFIFLFFLFVMNEMSSPQLPKNNL